MNVPSCIEANTKDKTMLIRFGGRAQKSVWVNGLELREYDFDMEDFLTGEHSVGEVTAHELSQCWEVTELDEEENELFNSFCFDRKGVFDKEKFANLHDALANHNEEKVKAAIDCGVDLDKIDDQFVGKGDVKRFAIETFWEMYGYEIPEHLVKYIDADVIVDLHSENLSESGGYVFDTSR